MTQEQCLPSAMLGTEAFQEAGKQMLFGFVEGFSAGMAMSDSKIMESWKISPDLWDSLTDEDKARIYWFEAQKASMQFYEEQRAAFLRDSAANLR